MSDLVHDVEAIHDLCYLLKAIAVSRASPVFQKRFPDAVSSELRKIKY